MDGTELLSDGMLYILNEHKNTKGIYTYHIICNHGEYDEPISLNMIREKYPDVNMVIFEDAFEGRIYRYNNYGTKEWECIGETKGYA